MIPLTKQEQLYIKNTLFDDENSMVFKSDDEYYNFIEVFENNPDDWAYAEVPDLEHADSTGWSVRGDREGIIAEINEVEMDPDTRAALLAFIAKRTQELSGVTEASPAEASPIPVKEAIGGKHVYVQLYNTETRLYIIEHCKIFIDGDEVAGGYYKWQNRSWQRYEYASAMRNALRSMGREDIAALISECYGTDTAEEIIIRELSAQPVVETITPKSINRNVSKVIIESLVEPAPWMKPATEAVDGAAVIKSWNISQPTWEAFEKLLGQARAMCNTNDGWNQFFDKAGPELDTIDRALAEALEEAIGMTDDEEILTPILNGLRRGYEKEGTEPHTALDLLSSILSDAVV